MTNYAHEKYLIYKLGKTTVTKSNLKKQYRRCLIRPELKLYLRVSNYDLFEDQMLQKFHMSRIPHESRALSEFVEGVSLKKLKRTAKKLQMKECYFPKKKVETRLHPSLAIETKSYPPLIPTGERLPKARTISHPPAQVRIRIVPKDSVLLNKNSQPIRVVFESSGSISSK